MDKGDLERMKRMKSYCEDVAKAIDRFGNSFETFSQDNDFYNSVSMGIMQIGELANGLSDEFKDATRQQVQWGFIRGMRNRFAHAYLIMGKEDIWETAVKDIPALLNFCESIIKKTAPETQKVIKPKDRDAR